VEFEKKNAMQLIGGGLTIFVIQDGIGSGDVHHQAIALD